MNSPKTWIWKTASCLTFTPSSFHPVLACSLSCTWAAAWWLCNFSSPSVVVFTCGTRLPQTHFQQNSSFVHPFDKWVRYPLCEEFVMYSVVPPSSGSLVSLWMGAWTTMNSLWRSLSVWELSSSEALDFKKGWDDHRCSCTGCSYFLWTKYEVLATLNKYCGRVCDSVQHNETLKN